MDKGLGLLGNVISVGGVPHSVKYAVADPRGGGVRYLFTDKHLRGLFSYFFVCQYMKIPAELDPKPPLKNSCSDPPPPPSKNS